MKEKDNRYVKAMRVNKRELKALFLCYAFNNTFDIFFEEV